MQLLYTLPEELPIMRPILGARPLVELSTSDYARTFLYLSASLTLAFICTYIHFVRIVNHFLACQTLPTSDQ